MDTQKIKEIIIKDLKNDIPELISGKNDFLLNRLTSKKNIVFELIFQKKPLNFPKVVVLKLFRTEYAEIEYKILKRLEKQDIKVPNIIFYKKPYIILEKINGINMANYINNNLKSINSLQDLKLQTRRKLKHSIKKLAKWLAKLHSNNIVKKTNIEVIVLNKGDTRLRDFLYNPTTHVIYGLDFEESYEGNFNDDLAWICCALLDTNPGIFEMEDPRPKVQLIKVFLSKYYKVNPDFPFSFKYFAEKLIEYLNIVIERRELEFTQVRTDAILKHINEMI